MQVKVLGAGCARCQQLYDAARRVLDAEGIAAELVKIERLDEILRHGVMMTPGLLVDGELKSTGRVPRDDQLGAWFREAASRG